MFLRGKEVSLAVLVFIIAVFTPLQLSSFQEGSSSNVDRLIKMLKEEEASLRARELMLSQRERRLQMVKAQIESDIKRLMSLKRELDAYFKRIEELNNQRLIGLAKLCEAAPPDKAGKILASLDPAFAAEVLLRMNRRKAGAILGSMDPVAAARLARTIEKTIR